MRVRVFVVSRADPQGNPLGEPIAAKLTRGAAQAIAKEEAPCRITALWADKGPENQQQPSGSRVENDNGRYQGAESHVR